MILPRCRVTLRYQASCTITVVARDVGARGHYTRIVTLA
jgi:hypothetical protein